LSSFSPCVGPALDPNIGLYLSPYGKGRDCNTDRSSGLSHCRLFLPSFGLFFLPPCVSAEPHCLLAHRIGKFALTTEHSRRDQKRIQKVKQSRNRPGVAQRVPGGLGSRFHDANMVRLSASRTGHLYPQECSWYSFSLGA
jgi:hypothetical protein